MADLDAAATHRGIQSRRPRGPGASPMDHGAARGNGAVQLPTSESAPRKTGTMAGLDPSGQTVQRGQLGLRTPILSRARSMLSTPRPAPACARSVARPANSRPRSTAPRWRRRTSSRSPPPSCRASRVAGAAEPPLARRCSSMSLNPPEGFEQAVLSVDAHGVTTWSFAPVSSRAGAHAALQVREPSRSVERRALRQRPAPSQSPTL